MEVKQDEITQKQWDEMKKIARDYLCSECGGELTVHTIPEKATITVGCLNPDHHGWVERETWTQAFRRGELVPLPIQAAIENKMLEKTPLERAMNLLALRYPDAIRDPPTAALFIYDCARLGLEPLISPAEAIPIVFRSRKKKRDEKGEIVRGKDGKPIIEVKEAVQMVITGDGWLSMAARGCKEDWVGPPKCIRLEDYLMTLPEHKERSYEHIKEIASDIKNSECKDGDAWYYLAIGKRRGMGEDAIVPGYFTHKDMKKAEDGKLPAASEPGNQAIWRAQKKWVRKVYPECRQNMMKLTAEWIKRAEDIKEAQEYIDAEYRFISLPEGREEIGEKVGAAAPKAKTQATKTETSPTEEMSPEEAIEGEGFSIDLTWLSESKKALKWTDDTVKTFLVGKYKVSSTGTLTEVLQRLTREQAEDFTKEINSRVEKQTSLF